VEARDKEHLMAHAAARAESRPFFVASALAAYRDLAGVDNAGLAAHLGCTPAALARLALCGRPMEDDPMFTDRVRRIADHIGCDPVRLDSLLRAATAADKMRTSASGTLLAARDRISEEPAAYETPPDADHPNGEPHS
jgi:hypothetical protein